MREFKKNQVVPILDEFKRDGYIYRKIDETDQYYIYEVQRSLGTHWEFFEKNHLYVAKQERLSSSLENRQERYPNDNSFGVWAWCCNSKERVYELIDIFNSALSRKKPRSHHS